MIQNMIANSKKLGDIFKDNSNLKVPVFQRDYSWDKNNWKELIDDIFRGKNENINHYMGSIVLVDNNDYKEIIDGQQRITTISIVLLAIIKNFNYLIEKGIDEKDNLDRIEMINELISSKSGLRNLSRKNKLELNEKNNLIYSDYISKGKIDFDLDEGEYSNKLLMECYTYFYTVIKNKCIDITNNNEEKVNNLIDLCEYICENLIFVEITASDYGNAYVIFETLNDRGLDLAVTDLLKNYLFSKVNKNKHKRVKKYWDDIVDNIGEKNISKFIRHHWNSYNSKITEKELFRTLKNKIKKEEECIEYLNNLYECSKIYKEFANCNAKIWREDQKIREYIKQINLYGVDLCYPVLLSTVRNIKNINLKRKIFKLCSVISFRYTVIAKGAVNELEVFYNKLCRNIYLNKDDLDMNVIKSEAKEFLVPKDIFISKFSDKCINSKRNKKLIYSMLEEIEKNKGFEIKQNYTLEHILPENYDDNWNEAFENEAKEYRFRLGNYCILEKKINNEINNENFESKKIEYKNSSYSISKDVDNYKTWNKRSIEDRQKDMAKIIESTFIY